ncbi:hypothetical protein [Labrys sp. KNU-23]|uniref:hypothetical protein n=1 Tax=unclassified Labrys (in: a-proteobacteria) TaxID=2688601 RepID=UPI00165C969B|nr:hypothetical protein [Labrys sp. KNU-23]
MHQTAYEIALYVVLKGSDDMERLRSTLRRATFTSDEIERHLPAALAAAPSLKARMNRP